MIIHETYVLHRNTQDFPGSPEVKTLPATVRGVGLTSGLGELETPHTEGCGQSKGKEKKKFNLLTAPQTQG